MSGIGPAQIAQFAATMGQLFAQTPQQAQAAQSAQQLAQGALQDEARQRQEEAEKKKKKAGLLSAAGQVAGTAIGMAIPGGQALAPVIGQAIGGAIGSQVGGADESVLQSLGREGLNAGAGYATSKISSMAGDIGNKMLQPGGGTQLAPQAPTPSGMTPNKGGDLFNRTTTSIPGLGQGAVPGQAPGVIPGAPTGAVPQSTVQNTGLSVVAPQTAQYDAEWNAKAPIINQRANDLAPAPGSPEHAKAYAEQNLIEAGMGLVNAQGAGDTAKADFYEKKMHEISTQTGYDLDMDEKGNILGVKPIKPSGETFMPGQQTTPVGATERRQADVPVESATFGQKLWDSVTSPESLTSFMEIAGKYFGEGPHVDSAQMPAGLTPENQQMLKQEQLAFDRNALERSMSAETMALNKSRFMLDQQQAQLDAAYKQADLGMQKAQLDKTPTIDQQTQSELAVQDRRNEGSLAVAKETAVAAGKDDLNTARIRDLEERTRAIGENRKAEDQARVDTVLSKAEELGIRAGQSVYQTYGPALNNIVTPEPEKQRIMQNAEISKLETTIRYLRNAGRNIPEAQATADGYQAELDIIKESINKPVMTDGTTTPKATSTNGLSLSGDQLLAPGVTLRKR